MGIENNVLYPEEIAAFMIDSSGKLSPFDPASPVSNKSETESSPFTNISLRDLSPLQLNDSHQLFLDETLDLNDTDTEQLADSSTTSSTTISNTTNSTNPSTATCLDLLEKSVKTPTTPKYFTSMSLFTRLRGCFT